MKRKHHLIYIPGLGDFKDRGERQGLAIMRLFGIVPHFHRMLWYAGDFGPKLDSLLEQIDKYSDHGDAVSLMGFSAGASAALIAFAERHEKVAGVILISGKFAAAEKVADVTWSQNPAFVQSMGAVGASMERLSQKDRQRILSVRPRSDEVVDPEDTVIPGAREKTIPVNGHAPALIYSLLVNAMANARFLKKSA